MKKLLILFTVVALSGCATIFGGQKTDHQTHRPECNEPKREIRWGALVANSLLFPPGIIIDLATHKFWKPEPSDKVKKCEDEKTL